MSKNIADPAVERTSHMKQQAGLSSHRAWGNASKKTLPDFRHRSVMIKKCVLVFGSFLILCSGAASAEQLSAASILAEVAESDPRDVISRHFDKPEWQTILNGIGTADDNWLKVYVALRKGSDGASGEDLSDALWDVALLKTPFKVFAIEHESSCEFTFESACPPGGIDNYLDHLEQALDQASTPDQHMMRNRCLAGIRKTRAAFPNPEAYCTQ